MGIGLVHHAVSAILPPVGAFGGVASLDLDGFLATYRRDTPRLVWTGLVVASLFFLLTPIWTVRKPTLSCWLSNEHRDRHAMTLEASRLYPVRQLMFLLKMVAGLCWGQHDQVRASLDLPPYVALAPGWRRS